MALQDRTDKNRSKSSQPAPGPIFVLRGHAADVQALCFHPHAEILYSGDAAGVVNVWSLANQRLQKSFSLHTPEAGILALHFLQTVSAQLLSQGRDGTIKCWDLGEVFPKTSPRLVLQTLSFNFCRSILIPNISWAPSSFQEAPTTGRKEQIHLIALSGSEAADIEFWGLEWGRLARTLSQPEGMKLGMCMSLASIEKSNACLLLAGYEDGTVALWDLACPKSPLTTCKPHSEPVLALAAFQSVAFSTSAEDFVQKLILDLDSPRILLEKSQTFKEAGVSDIIVRNDGRISATAGWDKKIRIFSTKNLRPLAVLQYHKKAVATLAFAPHSNYLVSAARDFTIAFWNVFS